MSTAQKREEINYAAMMGHFKSPLASLQIDRSNRQAQNLQTVMFVWHPWLDINNRGVAGMMGDLRYAVLPRMELIPLYAWPVAVIQAGAGGFSYGGQMGDWRPSEMAGITADGKMDHGFGVIGGTGKSKVTQRSMLAWESRKFIEDNYGAYGAMVLDSLTAEDDAGKVESMLLFEGIMRNTRPLLDGEGKATGERSLRGVDCLIEDLSAWLAGEALQMLDYILEHGVDYQGSDFLEENKLALPPRHYALAPQSRTKGIRFIEDATRNVVISVKAAVDKQHGILSRTKAEMKKAAAHIPDSKAFPDLRDDFLLSQFPSFSMDTDVERASQATQNVVDSIARSGQSQSDVMVAMLQQTATLLEEMRAMRMEINDLKGKKEKQAA